MSSGFPLSAGINEKVSLPGDAGGGGKRAQS